MIEPIIPAQNFVYKRKVVMKTLAELKEIERKFIEEQLIKEEADRKLRQAEDERWKREDYPKIVQEILEDIPKKLEEQLLKDKRLPDTFIYSLDTNNYKYRQRSSEIVSEVIVKLREQGYNVRRELEISLFCRLF